MRISDWSSDVCSSDLAVGQPERGGRISIVGDEAAPLGVGDRPIGERMGREIMPMHRRFAIEGEACVRGSDIHQTGLAGMPCDLRTVVMYFSKGRVRPQLGAKRVLEEQVLESGQRQFLMLRFMIEAQFKRVWNALAHTGHRLR